MSNQDRKRRQEPDVHQPIKEPGHKKHQVEPGQKTAKPEEQQQGRQNKEK